MHADRILGDGSWTRGKRQEARMSLVTSGCPRVRTPSSNHAARQKWRRSTFPAQVTTPSSAHSGSAQCRRCETAKSTMGLSRSLSRSSVQIQAWPALQTRSKSRSCAPANVSSRRCEQGPSEVPASPLLPSRLKARLPLRPLSSSLSRITFSFLRVVT